MDLLDLDPDGGPVPQALVASPAEIAALDATLRAADWPQIQRLWQLGWTNAGIYRLLRLRAAGCRTEPATDGLGADPRALFARWLVATGRLNEGG